MHKTVITWWMLLIGGLLIIVSIAGCGVKHAPGTPSGQPPVATADPTSALPGTPAPTASPTGTPSPTPAGVQNLTISRAERSKLVAAFVAHRGIALVDLEGADALPGSVYYAYDPATGSYWALAEFGPSATASLQVKVNFQDGGNIGMFRKADAGHWRVRTPDWPPICGETAFFPRAVLRAWALPKSPSSGMDC